jgi:class 3 adenylate cyclase
MVPFDLKDGIAIATGIVGLGASAIAIIRYFAKKEKLEGDIARLQERYDELNNRYGEVVEVIGRVKISGTATLLLKSEIDSQLELVTKALQAKASSIMVPLPGKNPTNLVFLSVLGPVAHQLHRTTVPIDKGIAANVFLTGKPYLVADTGDDNEFFKGVDVISSYSTVDLLCVPIVNEGRTIGVMQLLNKNEGAFSVQDLGIAQRFAESLSVKMAQFLADPQNFELLGFASAEQTRDGTILFCDLTASSLLIDTMNFSSAISLMNSYLERSCDIVMQHGGTIDKLLGDGAMLRFNVPREIRDSRMQAIRAALSMRDAFVKQKNSWFKAGMPVSSLYTRIGIASGPLREAIMGHPQFQSLTVVGEPVILASNLCSGAPRDRNVILATRETIDGVEHLLNVKPVPQTILKRIKGQQTAVYELFSCTADTPTFTRIGDSPL